MVGIDANGQHVERDAIISGIIVGVIEVLNKLPEGRLPGAIDVYSALRLGAIAGLAFYCLNKGIKYRNSKKEG